MLYTSLDVCDAVCGQPALHSNAIKMSILMHCVVHLASSLHTWQYLKSF